MAFLIVGATTVPVAVGSFSEAEPVEVGERVRAFDGTTRDAVRDTKRVWRGTTRLLTSAEYTSVRTALEAGSQSCSGDGLGATTTIRPRVTGVETVAVEGGIRRAISFELEEV